jgi:hypothetical protein
VSFVIGADGANGIVARAAGLGDGIVTGVALEANAAWGALEPTPYDGTAWVELGVVGGGYGWVFPKGDHANLGVGGWHGEGPRLRAHLERLAHQHAVDPERLRDLRGHRLPMRRLGARAARGRALLVGDAAGLVDPLSGTACTRRSSRPASPRMPSWRGARRTTRCGSRLPSTGTRPLPGRRSVSLHGFRACASGRHAPRESSTLWPASCEETSRIRAMRAGLRSRPCERSHAWRV